MQGKKILLVDSREDFFETCTPELQSRNFEVATATSFNEALKKVEEFKPDFILTALMLEHFDSGFVLSYKIKKKNPQIPIYILTSATHTTGIKFSVNTEEEREWIKADGFLNEPIKPEDLVDLIEGYFKKHAPIEDIPHH